MSITEGSLSKLMSNFVCAILNEKKSVNCFLIVTDLQAAKNQRIVPMRA